ncbi:MAG: acylphosphatase [Candidatus Omnitrophica bacterium]|jgi:acylphosphatase|nr:acylphosphatase [Candidatus Omnitrophota bacterium]
MKKNATKHYRVFFSGMVQGVGFRYTTQAIADKYAIYGWVANRGNGTVELDIEGASYNLDNFLKDLKEEFKTYIKDVQIEELPIGEKYNDFQIRFY